MMNFLAPASVASHRLPIMMIISDSRHSVATDTSSDGDDDNVGADASRPHSSRADGGDGQLSSWRPYITSPVEFLLRASAGHSAPAPAPAARQTGRQLFAGLRPRQSEWNRQQRREMIYEVAIVFSDILNGFNWVFMGSILFAARLA